MDTLDYVAIIHCPDLDHVRSVGFGPDGRLTIQLRDTSRTWQDRYQIIRQAVIDLADITESTLVRHTYHSKYVDNALLAYPPEIQHPQGRQSPAGYFSGLRGLDEIGVPDAGGCLVVTDQHLQRAHDLSHYTITPLGGRMHLVEANDLAPWFAHDTIPTEVIDHARTDFGDMVLTHLEETTSRDIIVAKKYPGGEILD